MNRLARTTAMLLAFTVLGLILLGRQQAHLLQLRATRNAAPPAPVPAIEPPAHPLLFGYFYADGRYGNHLDEVLATTNVYVACPDCFETSEDWRTEMRQTLSRGDMATREIIALAGEPSNWDALLEALAPHWSRVRFVEIAHEARIGRRAMTTRVADWRARVVARGLAVKPVGALQSTCQTWDLWRCAWWDGWKSPALDLVGIEAYLPIPDVDPRPRGLPAPVDYDPIHLAANVTALLTRTQARLAAHQQLYIVAMAYDRNGDWRRRTMLPAVQRATYDWARANGRVVALLPFAYARPGGVMGDSPLTSTLREIGTAIVQP